MLQCSDVICFLVSLSNIRKEKCRPATTPTTTTSPVSRSGYPPWIQKRAGLESSGRRLISSIGKTKGIAFFVFVENNLKINNNNRKKIIF